VRVTFKVWKVPGQPRADRFDSRHDAICKIAVPKSLGQGAGDAMPKLLAYPIVDAAVA
jgi:hypothetical protein